MPRYRMVQSLAVGLAQTGTGPGIQPVRVRGVELGPPA